MKPQLGAYHLLIISLRTVAKQNRQSYGGFAEDGHFDHTFAKASRDKRPLIIPLGKVAKNSHGGPTIMKTLYPYF